MIGFLIQRGCIELDKRDAVIKQQEEEIQHRKEKISSLERDLTMLGVRMAELIGLRDSWRHAWLLHLEETQAPPMVEGDLRVVFLGLQRRNATLEAAFLLQSPTQTDLRVTLPIRAGAKLRVAAGPVDFIFVTSYADASVPEALVFTVPKGS